jgi:hypothetical protein
MHDTNDFGAQMSYFLVLGTAGLILAAVLLIAVVEAVRRRRFRGLIPKQIRPPQPNYFRRIINTYRALREELKDRNAGKKWLRDYEETQERNAEARRRELDE